MKAVLVAAFLIPLTAAHLCLFYPVQRGSMMDVNKPGADDCNLEKPSPCGGRDTPGNPAAVMMPGEKATVVFQKNLDHFNKGSPGNFSVSIQAGSGNKWTTLTAVPDSNTTSLYVYSAMIEVPTDIAVGKGIIQVVYNTNNPQAPANFYQCADIMVTKPGNRDNIRGRPRMNKN